MSVEIDEETSSYARSYHENDSHPQEKEATRTYSCCGRLWTEFGLPFFGIKEVDGKIIDVKESFAPSPYLPTLLIKLVLFGWPLSVMVQSLLDFNYPYTYYFYLTSWGEVMALLYLVGSLLLTLFCIPKQTSDKPGFFVRLTWGLFGTAATAQIILTILFWALEYDYVTGSVKYLTVMKHGGIAVLTLFEGLFVNRIPVRVKHLLFVEIFALTFMLWSILHDVFDVGNPNRMDNDPTTDDDALYATLAWNNNTTQAIIIACVAVFVACPLLFVLVWTLSLWSMCRCRFDGSNRKYVTDAQEEDDDKSETGYTWVGIKI